MSALALTAVLSGLAGEHHTTARAATVPCGFLTGPPATFKHVVLIMDENQSYSAIIGAPGSPADQAAPNINAFARACGVAANYHAITHPSHSDYIATVAGDTYVPSGCSSWTCVSVPLDKPSIFQQVVAAGKQWRTYSESMPVNCDTNAADPYSAGHNPPVWFTNITTDCKNWAVPLTNLTTDLQNNALPAYSWIVPNKCNDMHNCSSGNPITAGDTFVKTWVNAIMATPDYQNGQTVIFLTWDEGVEGGRPFNEDCLAAANLGDESCHVATLVISPYTQPSTKPTTFFDHYGLLRTTETMLGITTFLAHAADASSTDMLAAFGLKLTDTTAPTVPAGLTSKVVTLTAAVKLNWSASTDNVGVTGYRVYRNGVKITQVASTSAKDTTTAYSTDYSYTVTAVDAAGNESAASSAAIVHTPPRAPTGLTASPVSAGEIDLTWNPVSTATSYKVFRNGTPIKTLNATSFNDLTVSGATSYTYTVKASDGTAVSAPSAPASATTAASPAAHLLRRRSRRGA